MIQFFKIIILIICLASFGIGKSFELIPCDDKLKMVKLSPKNDRHNYYEIKNNILFCSENLDESFTPDDSVRVKFFLREAIPEDQTESRFNIEFIINDNNSTKIKYDKIRSTIKRGKDNRGWAWTRTGVWFIDIHKEDFDKIIVSTKSKVIVRAEVNRINREKYSIGRKSLNVIDSRKKKIIEFYKDETSKKKVSYWYNLSDSKDILQYEVNGPTSIRVYTRLEEPSEESDKNNYTLFVKEDGLDIGMYYFNTELSYRSKVKRTGSSLGKYRSCFINVPSGKHYYSISKGKLSKNPIYVMVKEYEIKK